MPIEVDEDNLKSGLLGLVVALVEIIQEVLEHQVLRRIESGRLTEKETERLGNALMELDDALAKIKKDNGVEETVRNIRRGLDSVADDTLDKMINPARWEEELKKGVDEIVS